MVCNECRDNIEKTNILKSSNSSIKSINSNMFLNKKRYGVNQSILNCILCKGRVEGQSSYCLTCSHTKGICDICGKKMMDTKMYKYSDVDPRDNVRKNKMREKSKKMYESKFNKINNEKSIINNNLKKSEVCKKKDKQISIINPLISKFKYNEEDDYEYESVTKI